MTNKQEGEKVLIKCEISSNDHYYAIGFYMAVNECGVLEEKELNKKLLLLSPCIKHELEKAGFIFKEEADDA